MKQAVTKGALTAGSNSKKPDRPLLEKQPTTKQRIKEANDGSSERDLLTPSSLPHQLVLYNMRSTLVVPVLFVSLPTDCTSTREQKPTKRSRKCYSAESSSHLILVRKGLDHPDLCGLLETKREHCEGLICRTKER